MKKLSILATIILSSVLYSQVGINTTAPKATLEVSASESDLTKVDGIIPPKIKGDELRLKDNLYTSNQTGAIVYLTEATSAPRTLKTENVTGSGYYYFDGSVWQKIEAANLTANNGLTKNGNNVKLGGTLVENTTIATSSANTLKLTGLQDNISGDKLLAVGTDGTLRQGSIDQSFIPSLSTIALRTAVTATFNASTTTNIYFNSVPKIDPSLISYNSLTQVFFILKAGYYQVSIYVIYDNESNPNGQTSGTAITNILRNGVIIGGTSSNHAERTDNIYHNATTTVYFNVGDQLRFTGSFTRIYKFGANTNASITYLGS